MRVSDTRLYFFFLPWCLKVWQSLGRRSVCSGRSLATSQVKQSVPQLQKIGSDMFYIESRHPALQHQEGPPGLSAVTSTSTPSSQSSEPEPRWRIRNPEHQSASVTFLHPEWNNRFQQVAVDPRCFQLLLLRLLLLVRLKRAAVQPRNMKENRIIYEKAALSVVCSGIPRLATSRVNQPPSSRALWRAAF